MVWACGRLTNGTIPRNDYGFFFLRGAGRWTSASIKGGPRGFLVHSAIGHAIAPSVLRLSYIGEHESNTHNKKKKQKKKNKKKTPPNKKKKKREHLPVSQVVVVELPGGYKVPLVGLMGRKLGGVGQERVLGGVPFPGKKKGGQGRRARQAVPRINQRYYVPRRPGFPGNERISWPAGEKTNHGAIPSGPVGGDHIGSTGGGVRGGPGHACLGLWSTRKKVDRTRRNAMPHPRTLTQRSSGSSGHRTRGARRVTRDERKNRWRG